MKVRQDLELKEKELNEQRLLWKGMQKTMESMNQEVMNHITVETNIDGT